MNKLRWKRALLAMIVMVPLIITAPDGTALAAPADPVPGDTEKLPPEAYNDDPRSNGALNREIAREGDIDQPDPIYPDDSGPDPSAVRIPPVNNPSADQTALDTQSETTIATVGDNVIIGWNDSGSFLDGNHFTGFGHSPNGGVSFTDKGTLPNSSEGDAGDPVVATDKSTNTAYFATLGFTTGENIQVFKSTNGGSSFALPANGTPGYAGTGDFQDKEWIAVDNFAGAGQHNVYLCWTRFSASGGEVRFTRSTDMGTTFGPNLGELISSGGQGCYATVGNDHSVYVFYYRGTGPGGQGGDNKLFVRRSTDMGVTFAPEVEVADLLTTTVNGNLSLPGGLRSNSFPHVAVNPVSGYPYAIFNDNPADADDADVYLTMSKDNGATWSPPQQVNSDDGGKDQFFPTVSISEDGASAMISYYSRSNDPADLLFHRSGRIGEVKPTGKISWQPNFQLSPDTPVVIGQDPVINPTYMGDYDQIATTPGFFHSSWADNRDGNSFHLNQPDVYYAKVSQTPLASDPTLSITGTGAAPLGSNLDIRATVSNPGANTAEDTFVLLKLSGGPDAKSAIPSGGGKCDIQGQFIGCIMNNIASGTSKTIDVTAFAASNGQQAVHSKVTTSDIDTNKTNNSPSFFADVTGAKVTRTYSSGSISAPIPVIGTVDVPVIVDPDAIVLRMFASVRLNHTWDGDLALYLISPTGTVVPLSIHNGGSEDNYGTGPNDCTNAANPTVFKDASNDSIVNGLPPFEGTFRPEGSLGTFSGENMQGGWTLRVVDSADFDEGTVGCVELRITRPASAA